ncbi:hypothetical protein ESCO_003721 [Escovopsis weberi]|uniref:Zinc-finger domain-containing protein n=1 Tax=Escovopsis weberi TaxID=150374 RepID=A0A0M9VX68_ESCWE|nr:hypothetical protein ESCO_003721 [Escovopsis weberi]
MPSAQHPQAKFDPLPPDLDLQGLVERTANFKWVQRVSISQIRHLGQQEFEKLIAIHVIAGGKPLAIDGWDAVLPRGLFNAEWFEKNYDKRQENVRDISNATDIPMTTGHYLRSMKQLTNQWTPNTFRDERRQRLYLKDIDCPIEWRETLQKIIHPSLFYLNENVTTTGIESEKEDTIFRNETTAASAGDLMSSLPEQMRAQNLMCYIGHEGTYTPAHREIKDREVVREYFLSMLGHDIEIEKHFAQVWNRGTRTMKVAWNRTTVETLDLALHEALPKARLVCRDEQYKNKAIIYYTLQKYHQELQALEEGADSGQMSFMGLGQDVIRNSPRTKQLAADFKRLFGLFTQLLVDEVFATKEKDVEFIPFDSCVTCSYCRSNIFNRFLTCKHCRENTPSDSEPDGEDDSSKKKKKKKKKKKGDLLRCHVCCHRDYSYRIHMCTNPGCSEGYCYGVLYRAFDMMPQQVLEDEHWKCPKCLGICNCASKHSSTSEFTI